MKQLSSIHFTIFALIISSLLMQYLYFYSTGNLNSPIIEYEFVKTSDDVKNIFMENNEFKKDIIQGVHDQNIVDYAYMILYNTFLILFFIKIKDFEKKRIFILGVVLAILALITDAIENILLFNISELLTTRNNFSSEINILIIITRIKWFSIASALFIISFHYFKFKTLGKIFAVLSSIPFILVLIYFLIQKEIIIQYFINSIILGFLILMVWVFIPKIKNKNVSFYNDSMFK